MTSLLSLCVKRIPPHTDVLVDVSNFSESQMQSLLADYTRPLLISTHKSFNAKLQFRRFGACTVWMVLRTPVDAANSATERAVFDATHQRFVRERSASPVRVRYRRRSGQSECSIVSRDGSSPFDHSNCEIDDNVLAHLSMASGIPLATHDKKLGRDVRKSAPLVVSRQMYRLMKHTGVTLLVRDRADKRWRKV